MSTFFPCGFFLWRCGGLPLFLIKKAEKEQAEICALYTQCVIIIYPFHLGES